MSVTTASLGLGFGLSMGQIGAILGAQYRSLVHFYSRGGKLGAIVIGVMSAAWYGLILFGAAAVAFLLSHAEPKDLSRLLAMGALFVIFYWQFIPLMVVSAGAGLDLKRLVVYPLTRPQLFGLDLLLRVTTGVEALLLIGGAAVGLLRNPGVRWWAVLAFVPFIVMNLGMASGLRALVGRWMTGRRTREITMLVLVLIATLPQVLFTTSLARRAGLEGGWATMAGTPWVLLAHWAAGQATLATVSGLLFWTAAGCGFGWWQFGRSLTWDETAARARNTSGERRNLTDWLFSWPAALFRDPVAALVEKELRSLSRTPRFRVVFFMGFSFSMVIWLPMMVRRGGAPPESFLAMMFGYALLLLGESCFWNVLGFDRGAAQFYFLAPAPFRQVLIAKNIATAIAVGAEFLCITAVALVLRLPVTFGRWAEAAAGGALVALLLMAAGNMGSVHAPRATDPSDVWRRASAGKTQALVLFLSPLLAAPVLLAYLARYAFDRELAFWAVLAIMAVIAAVGYSVALDSATIAAVERKESIAAALSRGSGPINS